MGKVTKRVVKEPAIRRAEIILVAGELFEENGYTNTPVEAIIQKAGIAKGTFYYYFKSKNEILKALVENTSVEMEELFNSIIESSNLTALEKLKLMLSGPKKNAITDSEIMDVIHKPENRELQEQLNIKAVTVIAPLLAKVFKQGYQEGIFNKLVTIEMIQLVLAGSQFVIGSGLFEWSSEQRAVFIQSLQILLEQLADTKPGELRFISDKG